MEEIEIRQPSILLLADFFSHVCIYVSVIVCVCVYVYIYVYSCASKKSTEDVVFQEKNNLFVKQCPSLLGPEA